MKTFFAGILLCLGTGLAAQPNPKIGAEKGVKEKLTLIKKGFADIKKNLTKQDENFTDSYNVIFEMGNGIVLFSEDEETNEQQLLIRYTHSYFAGTDADYKNYYTRLVALLKEVFGDTHQSVTENKDRESATVFYERGKDLLTSLTTISINYFPDLVSLGPHIDLSFSCKPK